MALVIACASVLWLSPAFAKPDYITKNGDGSIRTRGVYDTDKTGRVTSFTVCDAKGELLYKEVPYYADDGRIIRADRFNNSGKLELVIVYLEDSLTILDASGKFLRTEAFSQSAFLPATNSGLQNQHHEATNHVNSMGRGRDPMQYAPMTSEERQQYDTDLMNRSGKDLIAPVNSDGTIELPRKKTNALPEDVKVKSE